MERQESLELLREAAAVAGIDADVLPPESRYVQIDDLRFHYLNWPGATSPVIVFLHGGALTAHTWDLVSTALRNEYRCIALDQRGHGDTDWSSTMDYSRDAHCRDLASFVDSLWLGDIILVGHSMGGANALTFTARNPALVSALVLVDVGPEADVNGVQRIAEFVRGPAELPSVEDFVERAVAFNPRRKRELLRRSLLHNLRQLPDGNWTWKYDRRPYMDGNFFERKIQEMRTLWSDVHCIRCPTLIVRGAASESFTPEKAQRLADELPDGRWTTIANAGHNIQGDNPADLSTAIRDFLVDVGIAPSARTEPTASSRSDRRNSRRSTFSPRQRPPTNSDEA